MTVRSPLGLALSMAIVAFVAAAVGGPSAAATGKSGVDPALVAQLKRTARGSVMISEKRATKQVGFVGAGLER